MEGPAKGPCYFCKEGVDTFTLTVFAEAGNKDTPPYCAGCRSKVLEDFPVHVEQPDSSVGRKPPTKRDKARANKQELRLASKMGGRKQIGSGNQAHAKGDVRKKGEWRVEAKYTRNKSFPLSREILDKISSECVGMEKPAVQIDFLNPGTNAREDSWVALPLDVWEDLFNAAGDDR